MDKNFHPLSQDAQVQVLLRANLIFTLIITFGLLLIFIQTFNTKFTDVHDDETYFLDFSSHFLRYIY
jgi:hypothetical protein